MEDVTPLAAAVMGVFSEMERFLEEEPEFSDRDLVLDFYFCLRDFLYVYERLDGHYRIYGEASGTDSYLVRLFCVNPAKNLSECMDQGVSTILFRRRFCRSVIIRPFCRDRRGITRCTPTRRFQRKNVF